MIFFQIISLFGTPFFYAPSIVYLFNIKFDIAINLIFILIFTEIVCGAIKYIYPKKRPVPMPNKTFVQKYFAGSFPSVHTARISAFSVILIRFYTDKLFILVILLLLIIFVGYSRIYLKKHYFIDVLGGFLIGAMISSIGLLAQNNIGYYFSNH